MYFPTDLELAELAAWRHELHRRPEISGEEAETARAVRAALALTSPDKVIAYLGGHGVAAVYEGTDEGPTVMFRAELDGLPIEEISDLPYRSTVAGKGHLCGHDGHMAILMALANEFGRQRPRRGRVVLMFQPAEEHGAGAAAVIEDSKFAEIVPDYAFSLHNLPGLPLGHVALDSGPVNCASRGMKVELFGKTSHASLPEDGTSPMLAVAGLMPELTALADGGAMNANFALVTVTHARMGEPAFGIAPGHAEIWATLRTTTDAGMAGIVARAEALVAQRAAQAGLTFAVSYHDVFHHCENAPEAVAHLRHALQQEEVAHDSGVFPIKASEDFGRFAASGPSAMFYLGAGENYPQLHNPDYDFPDALIAIGARIFMRTARNLLD